LDRGHVGEKHDPSAGLDGSADRTEAVGGRDMTDQEYLDQSARLSKFNELTSRRKEIREALKLLTEPDPNGPCGQNPFTGNTRESRKVTDLQFGFTQTRGGAPGITLSVYDLNIRASDLGRAIEEMLRAELASVTKEMLDL
jgi:hypothetical protein